MKINRIAMGPAKLTPDEATALQIMALLSMDDSHWQVYLARNVFLDGEIKGMTIVNSLELIAIKLKQLGLDNYMLRSIAGYDVDFLPLEKWFGPDAMTSVEWKHPVYIQRGSAIFVERSPEHGSLLNLTVFYGDDRSLDSHSNNLSPDDLERYLVNSGAYMAIVKPCKYLVSYNFTAEDEETDDSPQCCVLRLEPNVVANSNSRVISGMVFARHKSIYGITSENYVNITAVELIEEDK